MRRGLLAALTVLVLVAGALHVPAEAETLKAQDAKQEGKWTFAAGGTMKGCMTTSTPGAALTFDVPLAPRGIYRVYLRVVKAGDAGHVKVKIGEKLEASLDTHSPATKRQSFYMIQGILPAGKHKVRIENLGKKSADRGGNYLYVESVEIATIHAQKGTGRFKAGDRIEAEECSAISGPWSLSTGSQRGAMMTSSNGAWMEYVIETPRAGNYQIGVLPYKEMDAGIMSLSVDGGKPREVDTYAPKRLHTWVDGGTHTLAKGTHTVRVAVTGKQSKASKGHWLYIDALRLTREVKDAALRFRELDFRPYGGWFYQPSAGGRLSKGKKTAHFVVEDTGRGMGWRARLPRPVDVSETPYAVLRYRASGNVGGFFTVRLLGSGGTADRPTKNFNVVTSSDLDVRNKQRRFVKRMRGNFRATEIAVALKSEFDRADLWLESITFTATKPKEKVTDTLPFQPVSSAVTKTERHFIPVELPARAHAGPFALPAGTDDGGLFSKAAIKVRSIPFRVTPLDRVPETGARWADQKPLEVGISGGTREIFLLIWARVPVTDVHGGPGRHPLGTIDQSERFTLELVNADGRSDFLIPYNVLEEHYGLKRGLYLYVVHPAEGSVPKRLVFHDKMGACSSSFALVAMTCNRGAPLSPEPGPGEATTWYPAVRKEFRTVRRKVKTGLRRRTARVTDGTVLAELDLTRGLKWRRLESPAYGTTRIASTPIFAVGRGQEWATSDQWQVTGKTRSKDGVAVELEHKSDKHSLAATFTMRADGPGKLKLGLVLRNTGDKDFTERVRFPIIEDIRLGSAADTWYYFAPAGAAMIHHIAGSANGSHGTEHPLQVDVFFNPKEWFALTLLSNDPQGVFRWYQIGKKGTGGWFREEYLERRLKPGATQTFPEPVVAFSPGDWHAGFDLYKQWIGTWYTPKPRARRWYRKAFVLGSWRSSAEREGITLAEQAKSAREDWGYCDAMRMYNWNIRDGNASYWSGEYDRRAVGSLVGGEEGFRELVRKAEAIGVAVDTYTDPILVHAASYHGLEKVKSWGIGGAKGEVWYTIDAGQPAYRPCLAVEEWLDYMVGCARYLTRDIGAGVLYLDETGYGARVCERPDHPHDSPAPHYNGERELARRIRAAIPDDVPICSEYQPEDLRIQYQDATHSSVYRTFQGRKKWIGAPVNSVRFAFPDFKIFSLMYSYSLKSGNYELLKFLLFNGDSLYHSRSYGIKDFYEEDSIKLTRKIFRLLHENADAFASDDVAPLVPTELPGVFANRFGGGKKAVWTLFNANYRTARGTVLKVKHVPGAKYVNLWNDSALDAAVDGGSAALSIEIGPREVGCIARLGG